MSKLIDRYFVAYFHFLGWYYVQLGFHVDFEGPSIELHIPFGFIRVGWRGFRADYPEWKDKTWGYRKES